MLACAACLLTGCVTSSKYKLAKKDTPPAQPLTWSVSVPPAQLTLETLIVVRGPGSWKYDARWDEYVVKVTNHGTQPMRFDSASLVDVLGEYYFHKRIAAFFNLRNVGDATEDLERAGPSTPAHAQFRQRIDYASLWTFGIKGTF